MHASLLRWRDDMKCFISQHWLVKELAHELHENYGKGNPLEVCTLTRC